MAIDPRLQQGQPQSNRVKNMQDLQDIAQSRTLIDDRQKIQDMSSKLPTSSSGISKGASSQPMVSSPIMQQQLNISKPPTGEQIKDGLFNAAFENLAKKAGVDLVGPIREVMEIAQMSEEQPVVTRQYGGLIGMAAGGKFEGKVPGQGHGMEDNVYMPIKEGSQQVATLAVSPDEYVIDAHTMSALGNGNADEGAKYMDSMVKNIRQKAFGTDKQPNEINGLAALRPMIERV
tara:strand:- start:352 stop:1047 length:696 start_codon:yes stop_codon:yes gene_type:complete